LLVDIVPEEKIKCHPGHNPERIPCPDHRAILMFLGAPLLLSSLYGILAGLALTVLLIARIVGEEKMLNRELEGYREYTQTVRYRLFPLLW